MRDADEFDRDLVATPEAEGGHFTGKTFSSAPALELARKTEPPAEQVGSSSEGPEAARIAHRGHATEGMGRGQPFIFSPLTAGRRLSGLA